jgi:hypothetical protein
MEKKYWDGWGFSDACNPDTPLNRTFRALELLQISKDPSYGNVALNTAYDNSVKWTKHLRPGCAYNKNDTAAGMHANKITYLYLQIFQTDIIRLASTIVHEARHTVKSHNGGTGCPARASCDKTYEYDGANAHELRYAWWYGVSSNNSTNFTRQFALDQARITQDLGFNKRPNLNIPKIAW